MPHRLHPRRPSRIPEWAAIVVAAAAALILIFFGPPSQTGGVFDLIIEAGRAR